MPVLECPICRQHITFQSRDEVPFRPFCSQRCQAVDLGRWLNEEYRISEELPPDGAVESEDADGASSSPGIPRIRFFGSRPTAGQQDDPPDDDLEPGGRT